MILTPVSWWWAETTGVKRSEPVGPSLGLPVDSLTSV